MTLFEIIVSVIFALVGTFISYVFWTTNQNTVEALKTLSKDHSTTKENHQKQLTVQNGEIIKHGLELLHQKEISQRAEREMKELLEWTSKRVDKFLEMAGKNKRSRS